MIRRILLAARKDLRRRWRAPLAVATLLSFPLVLSVTIALVFGDNAERGTARLLVEDLDPGPAGEALVELALLPRWQGRLEVIAVDSEHGRRQLEANTADALLRIPSGFTADYIAGREPTLELVRNPARGVSPELIERALRALLSALEASGASLPAAAKRLASGESLLSAPWLELTIAAPPGDGRERSAARTIFLMVLPGISIWALFMIGDLGMRDVLTEASAGTLRRQLSSRFTVTQLLLAKCLATAALAGICWLLLCALGYWAVERSIDLLAFSLLSIALLLSVTGLSAVIYGLARTERQGATISSALVLLMSFVGGAFVPVSALPPLLRALAPISPVFWANRAFAEVLQEGASLGAVGGAILALALLGSVALALGSSLLHRSLLRGWLA